MDGEHGESLAERSDIPGFDAGIGLEGSAGESRAPKRATLSVQIQAIAPPDWTDEDIYDLLADVVNGSGGLVTFDLRRRS